MRALVLGLVLIVLGSGAIPDWTAAGNAWWAHVQYLASDDLQGRNVGSAGYDKAADYVTEQFKQAGLEPAAESGYFQTVPFTETSLDPSKSRLALVRGAQALSVEVPSEAQLGYSAGAAASLQAPVVFAGYGLVIPEAHHNDLQNLPIKGAIVAFLTGGPSQIDGNLRSHYSSTEERWKALRAAGAAGMISIPNPKSMDIPWARQTAAWGHPRMSLADPAVAATTGLNNTATWHPEKAEALLSGSGHTFAEILNAADRDQPLPHFALTCSLKAEVSISNKRITSKNVVGLRRGTDPQLKNEFVIISAHLDHLGTGKPVNGDAIYNGAMDDASGVA